MVRIHLTLDGRFQGLIAEYSDARTYLIVSSAMLDQATLYRKFITSCHILHKRNVLDAYGHLSVRHPFHSDRFIMSRYVAPG